MNNDFEYRLGTDRRMKGYKYMSKSIGRVLVSLLVSGTVNLMLDFAHKKGHYIFVEVWILWVDFSMFIDLWKLS